MHNQLIFLLISSMLCIYSNSQAQQSEIQYDSDNTSPQLLITESNDPGNQANQDGWARIWFQNNANLNDRWAMLARPQAGATDNVSALTQPLIFAHNSNQILGISPDGSVRINKQYKLPKLSGLAGQVMTSDGNGETTWETPADDGVPTNGIILSPNVDPNIEASGYSYFGKSKQENFETYTTQDTIEFRLGNIGIQGRSHLWADDRCYFFGGSENINGTEVYSNEGKIFDPTTETFVVMSTVNAPSPREFAQMFWTGSKLIVIGGFDATGSLNTGSIYDPSNDTWAAMSTTNVPSYIFLISTAQGDKLISYVGWNAAGIPIDGTIYDIAADTWTTMSITNYPTDRNNHQQLIVGDKLVVYGGTLDGTNVFNNEGFIFDPNSNTWTVMSTANAHVATSLPTALSLGDKLMIWGGGNSSSPLVGGAIYDPLTDIWTTMSTTNAPSPRSGPGGIWTGTEVIMLGGSLYLGSTSKIFRDGGKYNPSTDTWTTITSNPDLEDDDASSVWRSISSHWTGSQLWLKGAIYDDTNGSFLPIVDYLALNNFPISMSSHIVNGTLYNFEKWPHERIVKFCMDCGDGSNIISYQKVFHMYMKN